MATRTRFSAIVVASALVGSLTAGTAAATLPTNAAAQGDKEIPKGWIESRINRMSLEEKVGQLFITYAYGDDVNTVDARNQSAHGVDTPGQLIEKYHLGGMIYFAWSDNLQDPEQIATLSNGVQETALDARVPIPMLISTDQEHGVVTRVGPPATAFPGNMALGAGRSADDANTAATISGEELRALGINQNYSPVADVNVNPLNPVIGVRSFGEDPDLVSSLTAAQVDGYQGSNVASTAKHFPGHGDTDDDSHIDTPIIRHTEEEWWALDAPPFQAAIDSGIDAIMTAHIVVPALDPAEDVATLSKPIMSGILRGELGYDGVVVTDSLGMEGVREHYGDDRVPVLALKAGVDMLLMPPNIDLAYNSVLDAVRSGELTERRINKSVERILKLKFKRGLFKEPYVDVDAIGDVVGTDEHYAAAQQITDRTTTLVTNNNDTLPLTQTDGDVLVTGWGVTTKQTLAGAISHYGPTTTVFDTGTNPDSASIEEAVTQAQEHDVVVVTTDRAWRDDRSGQRDLVAALADTGKPVIAISVRDPYDAAYLTDADAQLATYSYTAPSLQSAAATLFGEINPQGKLPVTIPVAGDPETTLFPYGHGLSY